MLPPPPRNYDTRGLAEMQAHDVYFERLQEKRLQIKTGAPWPPVVDVDAAGFVPAPLEQTALELFP